MKIVLAPRYRRWMFALLPSTLGVGSAVMWLQTLNWPLSLDDNGITLRNRRQVNWRSIRKIGVSRSYLDGHVSEISIHHENGISKVPARALHDGQAVVTTILERFQQTSRFEQFAKFERLQKFERHHPARDGGATQDYRRLPDTRKARPGSLPRETLSGRTPSGNTLPGNTRPGNTVAKKTKFEEQRT